MLASIIASSLLSVPRVQEVVNIPFRMTDSVIVVDATLNDRHVSALFDTGFGGDFVMPQSMDFGPQTGSMTLRDFVGESQAPTYAIKTLKLGDMTIDPTDKQIVGDWPEGSSIGFGTHVDGLMGIAVLKDFIFKIDMEHHQFVLYPTSHDISQTPVDNKKSFLIKILPIGTNSVQLPVTAPNGQTMTMALDTGNAFYATTHTDVLTRLGLWKQGAEAKYVGKSMIASGPVDSFALDLKGMNIFGVPVSQSVWDVIDLPSSESQSDGTVGFQFLKNFNITIDLKRRYVLMENYTGDNGGEAVATAGITAIYNQNQKRMQVIQVVKDGPADAAGIKVGDQMLAVDGKDVHPTGLVGFRHLMEGPTDSSVKIQVSRGGVLHTFVVKRQILVNEVTAG